ncbi:hypothetical protein AOA80_07420 [Methanomassiliicoccales archaeon RumEn M1]|nr:hypothetical protein AOA80_07420 [Methanomassiliicoccales archaeon RumEn M1]
MEEGPLNIRSEPDTKSEKVGTVAAGKIIEVNGMTDGWYKIGEGYISADYVVQSSADEAKAQEKKASESKHQAAPPPTARAIRALPLPCPLPRAPARARILPTTPSSSWGYPLCLWRQLSQGL